MKWRKWNHILHRDIGYFCIGLTLLYAISGIAVNHRSHSFNPSYNIVQSSATVSPLQKGVQPDQLYVAKVLKELSIDEPLKNAAYLSPQKVRIFTKSYTVDIEHGTGEASIERVEKIPILYEFNFLHLNKAKGMWTWMADLYSVALCFLAISGLLMIRGKQKLRGAVFTLIGCTLPVIFLILYA